MIAQYMNTNMLVPAPITTPPMMFRLYSLANSPSPASSTRLTVKKVDSTNPSKGLSGARFLIQSANGTYSKEVVTGSDGTYTLSPLDAGTYSVTEMAPPEGYEIDNAGPQYVVLPQRERYHRHSYLY